MNRNKRSLRLDLRHDDAGVRCSCARWKARRGGRGFRPGSMERLGLGYAVLAERNPRVVLCSISGYGQTGPYASVPVTTSTIRLRRRARPDRLRRRRAGAVEPADRRPARRHHGAVMGILVALFDRAAAAGAAGHVSMTDAAFAHMIFPLAEVLAHGGVQPARRGPAHRRVPCYGVYETADGRHMAVGALEEKFWGCCTTLGRADLIPGISPPGGRSTRAGRACDDLPRTQPARKWVEPVRPGRLLRDARVAPGEPARPAARARGMVVETNGLCHAGAAVRLGGIPPMPDAPAPARAGADTDAILEALGVDAEGLPGVAGARAWCPRRVDILSVAGLRRETAWRGFLRLRSVGVAGRAAWRPGLRAHQVPSGHIAASGEGLAPARSAAAFACLLGLLAHRLDRGERGALHLESLDAHLQHVQVHLEPALDRAHVGDALVQSSTSSVGVTMPGREKTHLVPHAAHELERILGVLVIGHRAFPFGG